MKIKTLAEVKKLIASEKPRFLCLRDFDNRPVVAWNKPGKRAAKLKDIEAALKRQSLPDGVYYIGFRDMLGPKHRETLFPVAKGNIELKDEAPPAPAPVREPETVWTASKAVEVLNENNRLELELKQAREKLAEYEMDDEDDDNDEDETGESKGIGQAILESVSLLAEAVKPIIEKNLELKERKIKLEEIKTQRAIVSKDIGEGPVRHKKPEYDNFIDQVIRQGNEQQLIFELNYLAQVDPAKRQQIIDKYGLNIEPVNHEDNGQGHGEQA